MRKQWSKTGLLCVMVLGSLMLSACKEEEAEPNPYEVQYQENLANAPERSEEVLAMIEMARGEKEVDSQGQETGVTLLSLSPGIEREVELSVLNKEQLKELDKTEQIDIFLNGILRDEYHVAAHTLYGKDEVAKYKSALKEALLQEQEDPDYGRIVDNIVTDSPMEDPDVARHFVDDVITHLNKAYIQPVVIEDFEDKVVIVGHTYPMLMKAILSSVTTNAPEFVELESTNEFQRTDKDREKLNAYYKDSFVNALRSADRSNAEANETIGGFTKNADGLWVPSDMTRLSSALIRLVYQY